MFRKLKYLILVPLTFLTLSPLGSTGNAATYGTVGVGYGCGGDCDGYYTTHFNAQVIADRINGGNLATSSFRGTMTEKNEYRDEWALMTLSVYSGGSLIISDSSKAGDLRREPYSTYWQTIYHSTPLIAGNNRIDFSFGYKLYDRWGVNRGTYYPIRRASNIQ